MPRQAVTTQIRHAQAGSTKQIRQVQVCPQPPIQGFPPMEDAHSHAAHSGPHPPHPFPLLLLVLHL